MGKVRVLVVDDDKNRADIVRRRLCEDFEIVNASPGPSAAHLLETEEFDLLISEQGKAAQRTVKNLTRESELVGNCPAMMELLTDIERAARQQGDLHLVGESGSGKALVARSVHRIEGRVGAFVCVRLSDLDAEEMEAAVFGHKLSAGGTLFLDGIERLSMSAQERLVRERNSGQLPSSSYRLICASSVPLGHASMSPALAQHLGVSLVQIPELRDRGEDIPRLAVHFVGEAMRRSGRVGLTIGRKAMAELCAYDWPGNVSELKSVIGDIVTRTNDHTEIGPGMMLSGGKSLIVEQVVVDIIGGCRGLDAAMAELEAAVIREALEQQQGNRSAAARQLKLPRQTLQDRMKKHGLWSS